VDCIRTKLFKNCYSAFGLLTFVTSDVIRNIRGRLKACGGQECRSGL
jgi:hypothetical protein